LLKAAGLSCECAPDRGLDHGAWVPLSLMYPDADIPVTQLSVQPHAGAAAHARVGRALEPLRREGVLVFASGGAVHNLSTFRRAAGTPDWAARFDEWLHEKLTAGAFEDVVNYRALSADARAAHPTEEHLLPLFVALGAGGEAARGRALHRSFTHGSFSMAAYAFG
jgi:4,5-DOPA dioxygenase extradiol